MTTRWVRLLGLVALVGCTDLPEGWEGAERLPDLTQSACGGDPYGETDERVELSSDGQGLLYQEAHFRCDQEVEAFGLTGADGYQVLVQPVDMNPRSVARCDCLYELSIGLGEPVTQSVGLWRRWDNLNEPNDPVFIGEVSPP